MRAWYLHTACVHKLAERQQISSNMPQKRSLVSPPKLQTSIISLTASNKRPSSNRTLTRSPIARAQEAILGNLSKKDKCLSNNPFESLAEEEEDWQEDDTCESTNSTRSPRNDTSLTPLSNKAKRAAARFKKAKEVLQDNSLRLELEELSRSSTHNEPKKWSSRKTWTRTVQIKREILLS